MSVRVRYKLEIAISSTQAEEKDLGNGKYEIVVDSQGEGGSWKLTLPAGAVNVPIQLGNVTTAKFLVIRTTPKNPNATPSVVKFRRETVVGEEINVQSLTTSKEGYLMLTTDSLTALFASNPGTVEMDLTLFVAGD
jgi:non-homologous end joining protein Ku